MDKSYGKVSPGGGSFGSFLAPIWELFGSKMVISFLALFWGPFGRPYFSKTSILCRQNVENKNLYKHGTGSACTMERRKHCKRRKSSKRATRNTRVGSRARCARSLAVGLGFASLGAGSASPRSGTHGRRPMRANVSKHVQACASMSSEPLLFSCCYCFLGCVIRDDPFLCCYAIRYLLLLLQSLLLRKLLSLSCCCCRRCCFIASLLLCVPIFRRAAVRPTCNSFATYLRCGSGSVMRCALLGISVRKRFRN